MKVTRPEIATVKVPRTAPVTGSLTTTVDGTATVVDLTTDPDARSRSQIASHNSPLGTLNLMQNSSGTALGEEADEFEPDLILCMLNPVATAYPNWDSFGHVNHLTSAFNKLMAAADASSFEQPIFSKTATVNANNCS